MMRVDYVNIIGSSVEGAVADKLYPDPYSYGDEPNDKLKAHIELQSELIAKLVEMLCERGHIKTHELEEILGPGYHVRLD